MMLIIKLQKNNNTLLGMDCNFSCNILGNIMNIYR